jgi:hypothetical protein
MIENFLREAEQARDESLRRIEENKTYALNEAAYHLAKYIASDLYERFKKNTEILERASYPIQEHILDFINIDLSKKSAGLRNVQTSIKRHMERFEALPIMLRDHKDFSSW